MFAFGTSERAHADLMLYGILNAACDASRGNPPSERDINQVLAAVTGIGAKDEIEGMLATQMVATHIPLSSRRCAAKSNLRRSLSGKDMGTSQ